MTNAEKYEEVFGFKPDTYSCPTRYCKNCPEDKSRSCRLNDNIRWWKREYNGRFMKGGTVC